MIRVVLRGRTGNNFFQYAAGRYLSEKHGVPLILDASWMATRDYRQALELHRLPLAAEIRRGPALAARCLRGVTGRHWLEWKFQDIFREPDHDHSFNPNFLKLGESSLLLGYFQSWKYFQEIRGTLLQEINLDSLPWDAASLALRDELSATESVAVHVRRTDYLDQELTRVCGETYHLRAMDLMRQQLPNPVFYFFSDDLEWCRNRFPFADCRFVDLPGAALDPFMDMRLMARASHNIIVNSSYSWWGAWLNRNPGQKVIAPSMWGIGGAKVPMEEKILSHWSTIAG